MMKIIPNQQKFHKVLFIVISLFAMSFLVTSAFSIDESSQNPVLLQIKPHVGENQAYMLRTENKITLDDGEVLITQVDGKMNTICLGVDDKGMIILASIGKLQSPKQSFENVSPEKAKIYEQAIKLPEFMEYYNVISKIFSINHQKSDGCNVEISSFQPMFDSSGTNMSSFIKGFQLPIFPSKPVDVGYKWSDEANGLAINGNFIGFENINDIKCAKIQYEIVYDSSMGKSNGTLINYLAIDDGIIIKSETRGESESPVGSVNMLNILELKERNKVPDNELAQMQLEISKLEDIFKHLENKEYDISKEMFNSFLNTNANSPFAEAILGVIEQIAFAEKLQERLNNR